MSLTQALRRLADAYHGGTRLALLFDYDGTLAPIVMHPDLAELPAATRQFLVQLAGLPRIEVGFISGRSLADLKSMVRMRNVVYAGSCGLELELPDSSMEHPRARERGPAIDHAVESLGPILSRYAGAWMEKKPLSITIHYRAVPREEAPFLRQCVDTAMRRYRGLLTTVDASKAFEILPDIGWNKGEAARFIVERHLEPTVVLYAGNDANDFHALEWVACRAGVSIGVGPSAPSCAEFCVDDTEYLGHELGLLSKWLAPISREN
jgi:trehalose 6-phosphate phosphatase